MSRTKTNLITEQEKCEGNTVKGKKPNDVLFGSDTTNEAFKHHEEGECMRIRVWALSSGDTISVFETDKSTGSKCADSGTGAEYPYAPCCDTPTVYAKVGTYYINGGGMFKFVHSGISGTASVKFNIIPSTEVTYQKECQCC